MHILRCDQTARLFFQFWPFTAMNICTKAFKTCQSRFTILLNTKYTINDLPKTNNTLPKWRNFVKSGHTATRLNCKRKTQYKTATAIYLPLPMCANNDNKRKSNRTPPHVDKKLSKDFSFLLFLPLDYFPIRHSHLRRSANA